MFTGIISSLGTLCERKVLGVDARLKIDPHTHEPFYNLVEGESIAVNGACLSVERYTEQTFWVYASNETLRHTTLGSVPVGEIVNLERALRLGDRVGGHLVTGHVDCVATVETIERIGSSRKITLRFPPDYACEITAKGSVALDGISLTVTSCTADTVTVNLIPETQGHTTVPTWHRGKTINLETDILGKYVRRNLSQQPNNRPITLDFLTQHGFA